MIFAFNLVAFPVLAQVFDGLPITPREKRWFQEPFVQACCNLGDAFVSDLYFEKDGHWFAEITDGFDHDPNIMRQLIPPGTLVEIPPQMFDHMKSAPKNPTAHGIIFIHIVTSATGLSGWRHGSYVKPEDGDVLCWWPPAGG